MSISDDLDVHLVMDNYGTHKVDKVRHWLARHSRFHVHYTPTGSSWLNLAERLFAEVTQRCVKRGSHCSVRDLEDALLRYLDRRNENPTPFIWTADPDLIHVGRPCAAAASHAAFATGNELSATAG